MKNIIEILKESNIELTKEQEDSVTKLVNDNYKTIAEFERQKDKLSLAENNAKDIQTKFDDFKKNYDGVDVQELKKKINTLTNDIESQKTSYEVQISKMNLDSVLSAKAKEYGCKDFDLAKSQFNYEDLLDSKDQTNDIDKAFKTLKENKPILFEEEQNEPSVKGNIVGNSGQGENPNAEDLLLRQAMGLTTEKK
jgi:hypothetical protein